MKSLLYIIGLLLISCTSSKIHSQHPCPLKQRSASFDIINDSTFSFELQQLGRSYLNFVIDTCDKINDLEINLIGYVTFPDNTVVDHQRRMSEVTIIQAILVDKFTLKYMKYLGKTDSNGKFNIKINAEKKDVFILFNKRDFNRITALLTF